MKISLHDVHQALVELAAARAVGFRDARMLRRLRTAGHATATNGRPDSARNYGREAGDRVMARR